MAPADREWLKSNRVYQRVGDQRFVLSAIVIVLGALWLLGALAAVPALAAALILVVAVLLLSPQGAVDAPANPTIVDSDPTGERLLLLETALRGMPQPVIVLDVMAEVVAANVPARTITPSLRLGEPISLSLRAPEVLEVIRRAIASDVPQRVEFMEHVPIERWYQAIAVPATLPAHFEQAATRLIFVSFEDLTPLRRVEEMRADFIANASHELRTPLAALSGFIETLQGQARDDPAARAKFLPIMHAQATRMARLIDDLLSLSRIELNAHLRPNGRVALATIIRQVVDGLQTLARDRQVEIHVAAAAEPIDVLGDRDELLRVFENLTENALKYAASGKRIDITLSADMARGEAMVAVRDYGPGIAPEHLPRLTERFYRVDIADSRAQGGTGLGLALAKHILNRHGGRLTIESVQGAGATFSAYLPLATGRPALN
jgi:two-component system, OmpR family, phosphate regulon sensor histidine kinase PhoR